MERFLDKRTLRSQVAQCLPHLSDTALHPNMADATDMEVSVGPTQPSLHQPADQNTERIAQAVAAFLHHCINSGESSTDRDGTNKKKSWETTLNALIRLSNIENELCQTQATEQNQDKTNQFILKKHEDLENKVMTQQLAICGRPRIPATIPPHGILHLMYPRGTGPQLHLHRRTRRPPCRSTDRISPHLIMT